MNAVKSSSNAVRLDPRRVEQLKALGQKLGVSSAAAVSMMIREKIAAGVIAGDIPGIVVAKIDGGVSVRMDDGAEKKFDRNGATALVQTIRGVVDGTDAPNRINMDHGFAVQKQGTGFKVSLPFGTAGVSFSGDLVLDLADLIEKANA